MNNIDIQKAKSIYFIGAGGIGMSALVRYFLAKGKNVGGYDKVASELSEQLIQEGADIHYEDDFENISPLFKNRGETLIIITPAVPTEHQEWTNFRNQGFKILKRAEVLGQITQYTRGICIAGTHGKTTTSCMTAHLFKQSSLDCNAFLGGILKNYDSNLMISKASDFTIIEADEYDRSFHWLSPYMAAITSADPDHLDIYHTEEAYHESFVHFASLIKENGALIIRKGLPLKIKLKDNVRLYTYSAEEGGDFHAENIEIANGEIFFDFISPKGIIKNIQLGVPMKINIENGIAAMALAWLNGMTDQEIRQGMASFEGPKRRFDFQIKNEKIVFIDDYAHHPKELEASIESVKQLYPDKKLTLIFQPHLYSRTKDFHKEFASVLSQADEVMLLDIYPAREEPIPGVSSQMILDIMSKEVKKNVYTKENLLENIRNKKIEILLLAGAGDIDRLVKPIKKILEGNN
ncbi:UDP-N-acetylmuramate:L-alanine ligase [Bacteroidales bacterium]|nr:UDP-N-acetylmuramate:L-alanine ligase [Bacteroidales bacterium]